MIEIIADHRERRSGIIKELVKNGFKVNIQQLLAADYIVQTKDLAGKVVNVAVERKNQQDFFNSIIDKRILSQLLEMKNHFQSNVLILEGIENIYQVRNFHPNAIRGMLATIAVDLQVPIITTRNYRDTAAFLSILARRLEKERSPISLVQKRRAFTPEQQMESVLQALPAVGPTLAKSLLKHFGSVAQVIAASPQDLMEVDKIGKKKAEAIYQVLHTGYKA